MALVIGRAIEFLFGVWSKPSFNTLIRNKEHELTAGRPEKSTDCLTNAEIVSFESKSDKMNEL